MSGEHVDVLIIGAGISGIDAAYRLQERCPGRTFAILEGRGAKTALVTTRGFRDVLELARLRHPSLYDIFWEKPPPLVPLSETKL